MRKIKKIILHCSDSDVVKHDDVNIIKRWHIARGFKTVGYHFFIQGNGTEQRGRPLDEDTFIEPDEVGAHTIGYNFDSVGICLHGRKVFSYQQFRKLAIRIELLKHQCGLLNIDVVGHCQTTSGKKAGKTCPNFDVDRFKKKYLKKDPEQTKTKKDGQGSGGPSKGNKPGKQSGSKGSAGQKPKGSKDPGKD